MTDNIWIKWTQAFAVSDDKCSLFLFLDLEDVVPLPTKCSATITKQGITYQGSIKKGEAISIRQHYDTNYIKTLVSVKLIPYQHRNCFYLQMDSNYFAYH